MSASTMMPMPIPSSSGGTDYDQYKQEYMKSDKAESGTGIGVQPGSVSHTMAPMNQAVGASQMHQANSAQN